MHSSPSVIPSSEENILCFSNLNGNNMVMITQNVNNSNNNDTHIIQNNIIELCESDTGVVSK